MFLSTSARTTEVEQRICDAGQKVRALYNANKLFAVNYLAPEEGKLFRYIQSDEFARELKSIAGAVKNLKDVHRKERSAHQNTRAKADGSAGVNRGKQRAQVSTRITALDERSVRVVPRVG
jgi:hypothetical protein